MKEYMTSGHMWNVYKSHIISFLNYDCRAHWCFMVSGKKILWHQVICEKLNTTCLQAFIFDCVFKSWSQVWLQGIYDLWIRVISMFERFFVFFQIWKFSWNTRFGKSDLGTKTPGWLIWPEVIPFFFLPWNIYVPWSYNSKMIFYVICRHSTYAR